MYNTSNVFLSFSDNNECFSRPCQHGSKCNDLVNDYSCTCLPGYTGKECEKGK